MDFNLTKLGLKIQRNIRIFIDYINKTLDFIEERIDISQLTKFILIIFLISD